MTTWSNHGDARSSAANGGVVSRVILGAGVLGADGGERPEGQHDVTKRTELDDEDARQASSSRYTSSVACCMAAVV